MRPAHAARLPENPVVPCFVYAKIPLRPGVAERMPSMYEAVERVLSAHAAGTLIGWGRSVSSTDGRGIEAVTHQRLDIELGDQARGLALLQATLAGFDVPDGTELHYTVDGEALQMVSSGACWAAPTPSTATSRPSRRR